MIKKAYATLHQGADILGTPVGTTGELVLTSDSLRFVPSKLHINAKPIELPLGRVTALQEERIPTGLFGLTQAGLRVVCIDQEYLFTVRHVEDWRHAIEKQKKFAALRSERSDLRAAPEPRVEEIPTAREGRKLKEPSLPYRSDFEPQGGKWGPGALALVCIGLGVFGTFVGIAMFRVVGSLVRTLSFSPEIQAGYYYAFVLHSEWIVPASLLMGVLVAVGCYVHFSSQN